MQQIKKIQILKHGKYTSILSSDQYYLDYLKEHDLNELYLKVATEASSKVIFISFHLFQFPQSRVLNSHYIASLIKNKNYEAGISLFFFLLFIVSSAIEEMINKNPTSVFTYEYLLAACDKIADPRILNTIYYHAIQNIQDNAFLFIQYGEFLEEMNEYASAKEMFYHAYSITPTDDLARSIIRV